MRPRWLTFGAVASALSTLGLLASCSVGGDGGETRTVTVQQPPSGGEAPTQTQPSPEAGGAPPSSGGALVEADTTLDGLPTRFVVTELKRSGPTVILNARAEPAQRAESSVAGQIGQELSDGQTQELTTGTTEEGDVFDGVALIDPEGRKKYLVARDSEGRCVCSNQLNSRFIGQGPVNLEATLSAPPESVQRVNLTVPGVKTFTDVPLGR